MSFLADLNDAQRRAVDHQTGPLLVVVAGEPELPHTRALLGRILSLPLHP